jgi:hypothetical protein
MQCRQELTGFRDGIYSDWHRYTGALPMTDIDSMVIEGDPMLIEPCLWNEYTGSSKQDIEVYVLIEAKRELAKMDLYYPTTLANKRLADRASLPFLYVEYAADLSWFNVYFYNDIAKAKLKELYGTKKDPDVWHKMTETNYVKLLYKIRGMEAPAQVLKNRNNVIYW